MEIKVDEQTIEQFLNGGTTLLVVPDYQRPYSWKNGQLQDFWEDINSLDPEDIHFIGSIVLISGAYNPGNFNELEIVDGQQRLTTISILIKAIQDRYLELGADNEAESLKGYFYSEVLRRGKQIKLRPGKIDRQVYENLIDGNLETIKDTCISNSYYFFKEKLENLEQIHDLLDKIIYRVSFVTITTDSDKSAYRLFETLNDRGLDLSAVDLIKNYLLKEASENNIDNIKTMWEDIIDNLGDIDKVRYFRHYLLSSKMIEMRGKVTKDGLYDKFSEIVKKVDSIPVFVEDIKEQSILYNKIANSSIDKFDSSKNEEINSHLRNLSAIKASTSYTFLLRSFIELEHAGDLIKLLELIEIFAIRRNIVGVSTSDLDLIYNNLALDAFKKEGQWYEYAKKYLEKNMPTDDEFKLKFEFSQLQQNDQTKYILDKLETEGFGAGNKGKRVGNSYAVHIEHIAPQTMKDTSLWDGFSELDSDTQREYIMSVGNLTLLEKKPNIKASNNSFEIKKEYYAKDKTDMLMTHDLLEREKWGVTEIELRRMQLATMAVKIWKF